MDIEIQKISLHHLDVKNKLVKQVQIDFNKDTITKYVDNLINEILDNPNKRKFLFKDGETQVKSSIKQIVSDSENVDTVILNNAKRLLEKEIAAAEKIQRLGVKIQRGSLLHIHFTQNEKHRVLICKVEHDEILNEKSFEINRGLNTKINVFKSFLIYVKSETTHEEIYLNDKNSSKYWWDYFLELDQVITNEQNTENSVNKIIIPVDRYKKNKDYSLDCAILRNNVIGYYRSNKNFNFSDLLDSVFDEYKPYNDKFPIDTIIKNIKKLSDDSSFDKQFLIVPNKINKKKVNKIKMAPGIFLNIEDFVKNLDTIFKPYSKNGENGLIIISDEAYNFVKYKV